VKNNLWVRGINIPPLPSELNGQSLVILYDCSFLELEHLCKNFTGTFRNKASLTCDYNYLTTSGAKMLYQFQMFWSSCRHVLFKLKRINFIKRFIFVRIVLTVITFKELRFFLKAINFRMHCLIFRNGIGIVFINKSNINCSSSTCITLMVDSRQYIWAL
jgi:hypothetical protein